MSEFSEQPGQADTSITPSAAELRPTAESTPMQEFDHALAEYEQKAQKTDQQLLTVMRDFVKWKNELDWKIKNPEEEEDSWRREQDVEYRITTTAADGTPRVLEVLGAPWGGLSGVTELDANGAVLGHVLFLNGRDQKLYGDRPHFEYGSSMVIGYISADDPQRQKYYPRGLDSNIVNASTAYGYTQNENGMGPSGLHRGRYVAPGMEHLPSPLDKGAEINEMIKRGAITHRRPEGSRAEWQPITSQPPTPPTAPSAPAGK